jgi:hypothetical protein
MEPFADERHHLAMRHEDAPASSLLRFLALEVDGHGREVADVVVPSDAEARGVGAANTRANPAPAAAVASAFSTAAIVVEAAVWAEAKERGWGVG